MIENGIKKGENYVIISPKDIKMYDFINKELQVPKKLLHQWRMTKQFTVNGEEYLNVDVIKKGDTISFPLFLKEEISPTPRSARIDVLYEDDHYLVLNKDAFMNVHPSHDAEGVTLDEIVAAYFTTKNIHSKVRHIHRLDKDTTGTILYAKHHLAAALMDQLLIDGKVKREYVAVVHGQVKKEIGVVEERIGKDPMNSKKRMVSTRGDQAKTFYKIISFNEKRNITILKLRLLTGRTHQIRVHMAHIGHPLVGDELYGGRKGLVKRQALHGETLSFFHPFKNEVITVSAPLPFDIIKLK